MARTTATFIVALLALAGTGRAVGQELTRDRLASIVIPEIRFESAHIRDVIDFLVQASRDADPEGRGVNIVYIEPRRHAAQPERPARPKRDDFWDPFAEPRREEPEAEAPRRAPTVSVELRDVTLREVLDVVSELTGIPYRLHGNVVMIGTRGSGQMVTRFYAVDPAMVPVILDRAEGRFR